MLNSSVFMLGRFVLLELESSRLYVLGICVLMVGILKIPQFRSIINDVCMELRIFDFLYERKILINASY